EKTADGDKHGGREDAQNAISPKVDRTVLLQMLAELKKNDILTLVELNIKEGETSPPKRYTSGSMILAMENAGQLIEDEELRAQIKGSGIGTSATRAEILKKLFNIKYLNLNKKTQVITPSLLGEMVYDVVDQSIRQLLNPELTASWEKGLTYVAEGSITSDEYMEKLNRFVAGRTVNVIHMNNQYNMRGYFDAAAAFYKTKKEN
ncbi:MAG: DNA topoisomerase, partial [Enterocloster clostridioformis]|nr:DNA topoisomerase [Enterocloster clostridioformis]